MSERWKERGERMDMEVNDSEELQEEGLDLVILNVTGAVEDPTNYSTNNVDSFPEIEAIIKTEDDSQQVPNEEDDAFIQSVSPDSIDIKYEFPEMAQPAPKKRRGRPPKSLRESVNATSSGLPLTKPCTVELTRLRLDTESNIITAPAVIPCNFLATLPLIHNLDEQDLTNCRLVCKVWKKSVDNYLARKRRLCQTSPDTAIAEPESVPCTSSSLSIAKTCTVKPSIRTDIKQEVENEDDKFEAATIWVDDVGTDEEEEKVDVKYKFPDEPHNQLNTRSHENLESFPKINALIPVEGPPPSEEALTQPEPVASTSSSLSPPTPWTSNVVRIKIISNPDIFNKSNAIASTSTTISDEDALISQEINLLLALPLLHSYLGKQNLIKCRTICRGWRDAVDNYLPNYFSSVTFEDIKRQNNFLCTFTNENESGNAGFNKKLLEFWKKMHNHPGNPLVGNAVHLRLTRRIVKENPARIPILQNYRNNQMRWFLKAFGKHIITLFIEGDWDPFVSFIIDDLPLLVPNLRNLLVGPSNNLGIPDTETAENVAYCFGNLEKVEIVDVPDDVLRPFIKRLSQSKVKVLCYQVDNPLQLFSLALNNLRELHVKKIKDISVLSACKIHAQVPQLELLGLDIDIPLELKNQALKILLEGLPSHKNLHTLRLNWTRLFVQNEWDPDVSPECLKCLKNIKNLEIYEGSLGAPALPDYSFLTYFSYVENVKIIRNKFENIPSKVLHVPFEEKVKVYNFLFSERTYESDIWEKMPGLKRFTFGRRIYRREVSASTAFRALLKPVASSSSSLSLTMPQNQFQPPMDMSIIFGGEGGDDTSVQPVLVRRRNKLTARKSTGGLPRQRR